MKKILFILYFLLNSLLTEALTYYSRQSGSWSDPNTWSTDSCGGTAATITPTNADNVIICNGDTVIVSSSPSFLSLIVETGGMLKNTFGNINVGTITFNDGAIYEHAIDGGIIPTAIWATNSECRITTITNITPAGFFGQSLGKLIWDCPSQNINAAFNTSFTVKGDFEVKNTNSLGLGVCSIGNQTISIDGDFIMTPTTTGLAAFYPYMGTNPFETGTLIVKGSVTIDKGTTGVLNGLGKSVFELTGPVNTSFNYPLGNAFSFNNTAIFEIKVNKTASAQVSFNGSLIFDPASGTPASILNIVSGTANIANNTIISVGTIEGTGTLIMQNNSSLYLKRYRIAYDNTFSGTLYANDGSTVFYDSSNSNNNMLIFAPSAGSYYHNIQLLGGTGVKALAGDIEVRGNWLNNSSFNSSISSVTFSGGNPQSIDGSNTTTFHTLIIDKTADNVTLNQNIIITNALTLTQGRLVLNTVILNYQGTSANLTRTNGWVETAGPGTFLKSSALGSFTFPVGSASHYQPITLNNAALGASVRFGTPSAAVPNSGVGSWFVNNLSIISDIVIDNPQGGTLTGGTSQIGIYNTSWTPQSGTIYPSTNIYGLNNVTFLASTIEFSVFTPSVITDFYTLANNAIWNVNSNLWSNDGTNPCNCSPNGVANANVRIRHDASIPASASVDVGTIINIENPVTLVTDQAFTAASLAGVSGARLAVSFNGLPAITTNTFAATAGTIVEFVGGAGTIPHLFGTANYRNLVISGTGNKTIGANTTIQENLTIVSGTLESGSFNLLVTGSTTIAAGATFLDATNGGLNEFGSSLTNNGSFLAAGGGANNSVFSFLGDITNSGTFDINCNCEYNFNKNTPPLLITPNSTMIFGSSGGGSGNFFSNTIIENGQNVIFNVTNASELLIENNVIVTNNNTTGVQINGNGTLKGAAANSTWLQGANAILAYASDQVPMSTGTLNASAFPNTVLYNRVGDQQLKATAYQTLELQNNSVKNIPANTGDLSVQNAFTVPAGITFRVNDGNFTASNSLIIDGTWEDNTTGGTNTFNGTVAIGNGGTMQVNGANTSFFIFNGNITNQGVFNLQNSSQWRLNANLTIQNLSANPMNFAEPNSGTGQVNGNVTILDGIGDVFLYTNVGSPISGSGSITNQLGDNGSAAGRKLVLERCQVPVTNASGAVIEYRGNTDIPIKMLTAVNNLFIYAQNTLSITNGSTFHHILFTNSSNSSLGGNITVNGDLTINAGNTLNAGSNNINIRGNWVGNGTFDAGTGSVIFDGTTHQTITTNASAFNNININNPAHVQINNNVESGSITFTNGRLQVGNFDLILTANPAINQIIQTFSNTSASYVETDGTGGLFRNNLQTGTEYVFPIGDATFIRHLSITPNGGTSAKASFGTLSPPAPTGSTDTAAGKWTLSGASGVLKFFNTGSTTNSARVHRLNAGNWDATGITTTAATPIYTTNNLSFVSGEDYTLFAPVNLTVLPSSPTLPSTEVGDNYSFTFSATGGTAPYTFTVSAGVLPTGLSLNASTGVLSGTPAQAGTFSFTITATDSSSNTGSQAYTLLVNKASQNIIASSLTFVTLGNDRFDVSVFTSKGLPAKLFSTNTNVARIENDTIIVLQKNFGEADIMAFHPGDANYLPSDTVLVMRVKNFEFVTALNTDLESKIKLFPNPTSGKIWVELAKISIDKLEIYNTLGQKQNIIWQQANDYLEINTDTLNQGFYLLHLQTPQGSITKRFSKL